MQQRDGGVEAQHLRLREHRQALTLSAGLHLRGAVERGVDVVVAELGDVEAAVAAEVGRHVGHRVAGVEHRGARQDERVEGAVERVGLDELVLAHVLLHDEAGGLELLLQQHRHLGQLGAVGERAEGDLDAVDLRGLRTLGEELRVLGDGAQVGRPGQRRAEQAARLVGAPLVHVLHEPGAVDRLARRGADGRVLERALRGVEVERVRARHGHLDHEILVELRHLAHRHRLDDVGVARAQRGGAGGAVGHEASIDAGRLRLLAPVVVVAVEGRARRAVDLHQLERSGAGADRVHGLGRVRLRREDRQLRAREPLGDERVGHGRLHHDGVGVGRLDGELDAVEDARHGRRLGRGLQRRHDLLRRQRRAVVEGDVAAQVERPRAVVGALPGGGEHRLRHAVGVELHERLCGAPARQLERVVAERGEAGARRLHHRDGDAAVAGLVAAAAGEAAGGEGEHQGGRAGAQ